MGNITVDRYFNRIVLSNPGTMLVSKEEFEEGGHSVCRNPLLQKMFVFIGVGEKGGSGADVIEKGWRDNGWHSLPTIREVSHPDRVEMILEIPAGNEVTMVKEEPTINRRTDDKIPTKPTTDDKIPTISRKADDKMGNRTLQIVLQFIKDHPRCKSVEIAQHIGLQITQTKSYIYRLLDAGLIEAYGANRNRTYSVKA